MEVETLVEEDCVETDPHQEPDSGGYLGEESVHTETVHPETDREAVVDSAIQNVRPTLLLHPLLLSFYIHQLTLCRIIFS